MTTAVSGRGRLARKYALFVGAAICLALGLNAVVNTIFAFADQRALVVRTQQEQAQAAAQRIGAFVSNIVMSLDWVSQTSSGGDPIEDLRMDGLRLLRQIPAIIDLQQIDPAGRERLGLSRFEFNRVNSGVDRSGEPAFREALRHGVYYGEVMFRRGSEPYITLARRSRAPAGGVVVATVNLTFIKELVSRLRVGIAGRAYVVTREGRLIAHPDLRFVLGKTDLLPLLLAHEGAGGDGRDAPGAGIETRDMEGRNVLSVVSGVPGVDWRVVVDLPQSEAFAPIYESILRSVFILFLSLLGAIGAGVLLSRRLVAPIRELSATAARIGEGTLDQPIAVRTGDELQELGDQFNLMAQRLSESRDELEGKVVARTAALMAALDQASAGQLAAEQARQTAEEATRAKSRFLAVVGHDIRTPLAGVLGVLEILDRKRLSQRERRLLEMATASGQTLIDLANATLDLSRLEAGTEALDLRDYEPGPLLAAAAALLRPSAERKGLALKLAVSALAGARLHGDPGKLNRIVVNLLRNAISFTDHGEIELHAELAAVAAGEGAVLVVCVRDTGIGIAPAMQERIFQDFVQVDPQTGRRSGGVGLGLAICTRLAALMGGSIAVESRAGAGSRFVVRLPASAARTAPGAPGGVAAAVDRPRIVLVVDDEPVTREVARIMIGKAGHRAIAVGSGEAALALLAENAVDIVLLDMHMTGMDGVETATAIRALPDIAQPAIVALTADVSPETMRRLREAGLTTILSKPATSAALRQLLGHGPLQAGRRAGASLAPDRPVDEAFFRRQGRLIGAGRLDRLVDLFGAVSGDLLAAMSAARGRADRSAIQRAAHQLASSAGALGLGQVLARAAALETEAHTGSEEAIADHVAGLEQARGQALAALAAMSRKAPARARSGGRRTGPGGGSGVALGVDPELVADAADGRDHARLAGVHQLAP